MEYLTWQVLGNVVVVVVVVECCCCETVVHNVVVVDEWWLWLVGRAAWETEKVVVYY